MSEGQGGWGQQPGGQPPQQPGWGQQPPPPPPPQPGWGQQPPPPPPGGFGPPPQGYGPPPGQYGPSKRTNGLAVGALIAGIIAFFTGWIFIGIAIGVAAVVMGFLGVKKANSGEADGGKGLAIAGIITGGLGIVFGIIMIIVVAFAADDVNNFGNEFSDLSECLNNAGNDQDEIDQCNNEFFGN